MRLAFLILAHKNPWQLSQLTRYLINQETDVFVHLDKKTAAGFEDYKAEFSKKVHVFSKYSVSWGSFSQIEATFFLLDQCLKSSSFDYVSLISAQDLPIKSLFKLKEFLLSAKGRSFLANYPLPAPEKLSGGGLHRMELFWLSPRPGIMRKPVDWTNVLIHKAQKLLGIKRRNKMPLYAGANWFTLHRSAAQYASSFIQSQPDFYRSFRFTRSGDEIILQSILMNSEHKANIVNDSLRYVDWGSSQAHPLIFTTKDESPLMAQPAFFARKFDEKTDKEIITSVLSKL